MGKQQGESGHETGWSDASQRRQAARDAGADREPRGLPDPMAEGVGIDDWDDGDW